MLSETKQQVQELINKVQVLDFVLNSLNLNHADYKDVIENQYKQASNHKLKLTSEILRLSNAAEIVLQPLSVAIGAVPEETVTNEK